MGDTRTDILDIAERLIQARGYNAFSYRDIALELGIKTASLHYHFPGKAALGEAVARRYIDAKLAWLSGLAEEESTTAGRVGAYLTAYRALVDSERMCLCLMLAAELLTLPDPVQTQVTRFVQGNLQWLAEAFALERDPDEARQEAVRLYAAVEGVMILARATDQEGLFDAIQAPYMR